MIKTLVVTSFNRPKLIRDCLDSCLNLENLDQYKIVMVHQRGNSEVEKVIAEYSKIFSTLVSTEPSGRITDAYITNNRILGLYIGFEFWKSDFVVSIEEDVIIAPDSLKFIEYAYEKYSNNRNFRGVNLGSRLSSFDIEPNSYSLLRFGMHGPASMITKMTWNKINPSRVMKNASIIFDAQVEFVLKTGFMVTPNASRYIDQGLEGSHTGNNPDDSYFQGLRRSFVGNLGVIHSYFLKNRKPVWRRDCIVYNSKDNYKFNIKSKLYWLLLKFPRIISMLNRRVW